MNTNTAYSSTVPDIVELELNSKTSKSSDMVSFIAASNRYNNKIEKMMCNKYLIIIHIYYIFVECRIPAASQNASTSSNPLAFLDTLGRSNGAI